MKIVWRTLIILAAALVVVGATMALAQTGWIDQLGAGERHGDGRFPAAGSFERPEGEFARPEGGFGHPEGGLHGEGRGEGRGEGGFNWQTQIKNLVVIGVIVAVVVLIDVLNRWRKRRRPRAA